MEYDENKKQQIIDEYLMNFKTISQDFVINEKPVPYARARAGRGGFYNPKAAIETKYRKLFASQVTSENYQVLSKLISNKDAEYYVEIVGDFYVPIPKTDSAKKTLLKEEKIILPSIRNGDIDNYMKLILDSLHTVIYDDDKHVVTIRANKYFSINARSEIKVNIKYI